MYIPKIYKSEDEKLMKSIINENGFALLISNKTHKILASHFQSESTSENNQKWR